MTGQTTQTPSDLFPILDAGGREFEVGMRGYDRRQVDDYVTRSEAEIHALTAERDHALNRSADLAAQLANAQAQIESANRRLTESVGEITPENVHPRVRPIVELAHTEARAVRESADTDAARTRQLSDADAAETRRQAAEDADRMRSQAQADLRRATEAARQREQDADNVMSRSQQTSAEMLNAARTEADRLLTEVRDETERITTESRDKRERLDAAGTQKRAQANEDFEIALRVRRTEAEAVDADRKRAAEQQAHQLVSDARTKAERLVTGARAEVQTLHDVRDQTHAELRGLHQRLGAVVAGTEAVPAAGPVRPPTTSVG